MSESSNNLPAYKRPLDTAKPLAADEMVQLPPWLQEMRSAISEQLSPDVMKDVIGKQVEKARGGDLRAAGFVMDQAHKLMAAETGRKVNITQNNFYNNRPEAKDDAPVAPAVDEPKTPVILPNGKPFLTAEERMKARVQAGDPTNSKTGYGGD